MPEYFQTLGIPLREGRLFADSDGDHKVASLCSGGRAACGRERIHLEALQDRRSRMVPSSKWPEWLAMCEESAWTASPSLTIYMPYWQRRTWYGPALAVKTAVDPLSMSSAVRRSSIAGSTELPVPRFETMEQAVDDSVAQRRFQMNLLLVFALTALLLASLGIYGVVSYSVILRTNEMGVRMAIGAQLPTFVKMIWRQAMTPVAIGACIGLVRRADCRTSLCRTALWSGTSRRIDDRRVVLLILGAVGTVASLIPALRASRVNPVTALRYE